MVLDADQLAIQWRRVSLTADFWAHYLALYVPATTSKERLDHQAVHSILSYLLNELFENCAKFSTSEERRIFFAAWKFDESMLFQVTNHIQPEGQEPFAAFLHELLAGSPDELYFRRIEENAETGQRGSGLGYLSLMMDFGIRFGFRFRPFVKSVAIDVQARVGIMRENP
jgi:hypothetical protein